MIKVTSNFDLNKSFLSAVSDRKVKKLKEILKALQEATPIDTGNARENWRIEKDKIVNDTEYIDVLNAGSSKQAPAYFIEKTLLTQQGVYPSGTIVRSS